MPRFSWPVRAPFTLRRLHSVDRAAALEMCRANPVDSVYIQQNLEQDKRGYTGAVGLFDNADSAMVALAWESGTIVPLGFDDDGLDILADTLRGRPYLANSLVGPRNQVMGLWRRIEDDWGPSRDERVPQYSMVLGADSPIEPDLEVRPATPDEASLVLPAAIAMFTEEVGYDPTVHGNAYAVRSRELIGAGHTYIKLGPRQDGAGRRVIFKADVGVLSSDVAQLQGVWTAPDLRRRGIATAALASVVRQVRRDHAPTVSLYVNHYNTAAIRLYERLGFRVDSEWATILL